MLAIPNPFRLLITRNGHIATLQLKEMQQLGIAVPKDIFQEFLARDSPPAIQPSFPALELRFHATGQTTKVDPDAATSASQHLGRWASPPGLRFLQEFARPVRIYVQHPASAAWRVGIVVFRQLVAVDGRSALKPGCGKCLDLRLMRRGLTFWLRVDVEEPATRSTTSAPGAATASGQLPLRPTRQAGSAWARFAPSAPPAQPLHLS
jgi:hypothetical protein